MGSPHNGYLPISQNQKMEVNIKSEKLDNVRSTDICHPNQEAKAHPTQASKIQLEHVDKRVQQNPFAGTATTQLHNVSEETVANSHLNTESGLFIPWRLDKKLRDYEMTTKSVTDFMEMVTGGLADGEVISGNIPQTNLSDSNWEECESELEKLVMKYEQERAELVSMLNNMIAHLIRKADENEPADEDCGEMEVNGDERFSKKVESALLLIRNSCRRLAQWSNMV